MARRRVRGMVGIVGGVVATLVAGLLTATPASAVARTGAPEGVVVGASSEDTEAPLLTSVSVTPTHITAGDPVTVSWSVSDPHGLDRISLRFHNMRPEARGDTIVLGPTADERAAGTMTRRLSTSRFNGDYELFLVGTADTLGNSAVFNPDGTAVPSSPATGPTQHTVDFAPATISISGSKADESPPVLESLTVLGPPPAIGTASAFSYTASDATAVSAVTLSYTRPDGKSATSYAVSPNLTGTVPFTPTLIGTYTVDAVRVTDPYGYAEIYRRDGTMTNVLTGAVGHHSLDFPALDFAVRPSALPFLTATARPAAARLEWQLSADEQSGVSGVRITVQPGGRVVDVPVGTSSEGVALIDGLANGTRYTFSVAANSSVGPGAARTVSTIPMISGNVMGVGDVDGDRRADLLAAHPDPDSLVRLYRSAGYPRFRPPTQWRVVSQLRTFPGGTASGRPSYLTISGEGQLVCHLLPSSGTNVPFVENGTGWASLRSIDGSADLSGDGLADIVAVTSTGALRLYKGNGKGRFGAGVQIGTGWGSMARVFVPGDVTGDRKADVMAVDSAGILWTYRGNGRGALSTRTKVSSGWGGLGALFSARDLNGDGRVDLGAITMKGELRIYQGRGNGTFQGATVVGTGWGGYL